MLALQSGQVIVEWTEREAVFHVWSEVAHVPGSSKGCLLAGCFELKAVALSFQNQLPIIGYQINLNDGRALSSLSPESLPMDKLSDPNLMPLPTHWEIEYVARSPCCNLFIHKLGALPIVVCCTHLLSEESELVVLVVVLWIMHYTKRWRSSCCSSNTFPKLSNLNQDVREKGTHFCIRKRIAYFLIRYVWLDMSGMISAQHSENAHKGNQVWKSFNHREPFQWAEHKLGQGRCPIASMHHPSSV